MLTRALFALRTIQLMTHIAEWGRDVLTPGSRLNEPVRREATERFLKDMRERLDDLERELNP